MWWETLLIAVIPSIITLLVTNWVNKKEANAKISKLIGEGKIVESENMKVILETYKSTLEQYKIEIEDVNKRFTDYIAKAAKRTQINQQKIEALEQKNLEKDKRISDLEKKINILVSEACVKKGCTEAVYLKEVSNE